MPRTLLKKINKSDFDEYEAIDKFGQYVYVKYKWYMITVLVARRKYMRHSELRFFKTWKINNHRRQDPYHLSPRDLTILLDQVHRAMETSKYYEIDLSGLWNYKGVHIDGRYKFK